MTSEQAIFSEWKELYLQLVTELISPYFIDYSYFKLPKISKSIDSLSHMTARKMLTLSF